MRSFEALSYRGQVARLKRLAEEALRYYSIGKAALRPLTHMENTTFRVDTPDGERYVIRIHRPGSSAAHPRRTEDQVRSEMEWLAALRSDTGLMVPEPVRTRDGALVTWAEAGGVPERRLCVLFRWVAGRFVSRGLTARHLERVGSFTARLHKHAVGFGPPEGFARPHVNDLSPKVAADLIDTFALVRSREEVELVKRKIEKVQLTMDALGAGREVFGLIHADLHQWNYLFYKGEVRAIDFDDCGWAHFLYDVAVTLSELRHRRDYPQLRAALLKGYRSVRPLSSEHESHLDGFLALRDLQLAWWFIAQRSHPAFTGWEAAVTERLREVRDYAE